MKENRLSEIRDLYEISQREVALKLGIGKSTYGRWETQERIIPLDRLNDFCNIYNVSMDYVMNLSNNNISYKKISNINKEILGKNIKYIRTKNKLTQEQLANFLNITHSTISAYESGKTIILTIFALAICKEYKISLDWLCGKRKNTS